MKPAKRKPARKAQKPTSDEWLIRQAILYAQGVSGFKVAHDVDSDCNCENASKVGYEAYNRGWAALRELVKTPATTPEAIQAEARLIAPMLDDSEGLLRGREQAFLLAFANNVIRAMQPLIEQRWQAKLQAKEAEAA